MKQQQGLFSLICSWAGISVVAGFSGCANPELSYVEFENRPGVDGGEGVASTQSEPPTQSSNVAATTGGLLTLPPTGEDTKPQSSNVDGGDSDTRSSTEESVDSSTEQGDGQVTTTDISSRVDTTTTTPPPITDASTRDAGPPGADADQETSILCDCPAEINPCLRALCLAGVTICTLIPLPGAECDDGNPCTQEDTCNELGMCGGEPKDCSSEDGVCLEGVCNEDNGQCEAQPSAKNTPCDDLDRCSVDDTCDGEGQCQGDPRDCSDLNSSCTAGACDETSGECVALPTNEGESCDDDDRCTDGDVCSAAGVCQGEMIDCSAESGACAVGVCDPDNGDCKAEPLSGIACDDGDSCTALDSCDTGKCKGQKADNCGDAGELDLSSGSATITMSNSCAKDDFNVGKRIPEDSDCDRASGDDVVFILDLSAFNDTVTVRASTDFEQTEFDTVLYLTNQECGVDALIACVDDGGSDGFGSTLETRVEPGFYALVVDAYRGNEQGLFRLDVVVE